MTDRERHFITSRTSLHVLAVQVFVCHILLSALFSDSTVTKW